jgi:hypothetical protein
VADDDDVAAAGGKDDDEVEKPQWDEEEGTRGGDGARQGRLEGRIQPSLSEAVIMESDPAGVSTKEETEAVFRLPSPTAVGRADAGDEADEEPYDARLGTGTGSEDSSMLSMEDLYDDEEDAAADDEADCKDEDKRRWKAKGCGADEM